VALYILHTMTSHWPQLVSLLHWGRTPRVYAALLVCGMIAIRWIGHRQAQGRHQMTALVAAAGFALWALSDMVHEEPPLVYVGLLLVSAHEPLVQCPARTWLRPATLILSYLVGGILYEAGGRVALGALGATLLVLQAAVAVAIDRSEQHRLITSDSKSPQQSIVANNEALSTMLEEGELTSYVSWVQSCSISAIHGLITTSTPWLVTLEYQWTNAIHLGALFAGAVALAPIGGTFISPRFVVYAMNVRFVGDGTSVPMVISCWLFAAAVLHEGRSDVANNTG
jgi:hypothetical protein